jgi:uncharacterized protein (UPF0335 family)
MKNTEHLLLELENLIAKRTSGEITEKMFIEKTNPITMELARRSMASTQRMDKKVQELQESLRDIEENAESMAFANKMMEVFIEEKGLDDEFLEFAEQEIKNLANKARFLS